MRCEDCGKKDVKVIGFSGNYYCQEFKIEALKLKIKMRE